MQERNLAEHNSLIILLSGVNALSSSQVSTLRGAAQPSVSVCSVERLVPATIQVYIVEQCKAANLQDMLDLGAISILTESLDADAEHKSIDRARLRHIFVECFTESDLKDLCFDLQMMDYENLPGDSKRDKARELIRCAEKRHCLSDLVKVARVNHPDITWEEVFEV